MTKLDAFEARWSTDCTISPGFAMGLRHAETDTLDLGRVRAWLRAPLGVAQPRPDTIIIRIETCPPSAGRAHVGIAGSSGEPTGDTDNEGANQERLRRAPPRQPARADGP